MGSSVGPSLSRYQLSSRLMERDENQRWGLEKNGGYASLETRLGGPSEPRGLGMRLLYVYTVDSG